MLKTKEARKKQKSLLTSL